MEPWQPSLFPVAVMMQQSTNLDWLHCARRVAPNDAAMAGPSVTKNKPISLDEATSTTLSEPIDCSTGIGIPLSSDAIFWLLPQTYNSFDREIAEANELDISTLATSESCKALTTRGIQKGGTLSQPERSAILAMDRPEMGSES